MKKLVAVSALLASVAAFATSVTSDNTFGVLKIADTTSQQLIISVPWVAVGDGETNVKITDLVLPTGLEDGTMLYYFDQTESKYMSFKVSGGSWMDGKLNTGLEYDANQAIARGSALIIVRPESTTYPPIYLSGQYAQAASSTIAAATASEPSYTLIAPTVANSTSVNLNVYSWSKANRGDAITFGTTTYNFDGTNWYTETQGTDSPIQVEGGSTFTPPTKVIDNITIPAGQGAWYIRAKGGDSFSVNW